MKTLLKELENQELTLQEFTEILLKLKSILKTETAEIQTEEIINLCLKNWTKFGKIKQNLKIQAAKSFQILKTCEFQWESGIFSVESAANLEKESRDLLSTLNQTDITTPEYWISFILKQSNLIIQNMKKDLSLISLELQPVHSRLVTIKKELENLLSRKSPHSYSLLQVNLLQDELREIETLKSDGKFCFEDCQGMVEYIIPKGQTLVFSLLESCYDGNFILVIADVHELLSCKDVLTMDNPLRNVYEKLVHLRASLESHEMTYKVSSLFKIFKIKSGH